MKRTVTNVGTLLASSHGTTLDVKSRCLLSSCFTYMARKLMLVAGLEQ